MRTILLGIMLISVLILAGCSQTVVKYQCADGSFVDSADACSAVECLTNCPELDCSNCPVKTETKVETKTVTEKIYVCPDLTEVKNKEDCIDTDSEGWYEIKTFTATDGNTEPFNINSNRWRYTASCQTLNPTGGYNYNLQVLKIENGEPVDVKDIFMGKCSDEPSYIYAGKGEYYFSISALNVRNWQIKVEAVK